MDIVDDGDAINDPPKAEPQERIPTTNDVTVYDMANNTNFSGNVDDDGNGTHGPSSNDVTIVATNLPAPMPDDSPHIQKSTRNQIT